MQNLQILPSIPSEFSPSVPTSSSDFVVSRRMREYVSDGQTTFSYDGNNTIKFTLNSADAFLDGRNSWLQFKLYASSSASGAADYAGVGGLTAQNGEILSRLLETGGGHALFSRLRISLSNGTIISDYDYSQLYGMVRQHTMSAQHLEFQEGFSSYDGIYSSCSDGNKLISEQMDTPIVNANIPTLAYDYGTQVLTTAAGDAQLFRVGDEIVFHFAGIGGGVADINSYSGCIFGKVKEITSNTTITLENTYSANAAADANVAAARIQALYRLSGKRTHRNRGAVGTLANPILMKIKLFSDFFNNVKYLPLPFLRNLTIELTLNRTAHAVQFSKRLAAASNPAMHWIIKDPVIVANLVTPSEQLINAYVDQYNSNEGIMLHWLDYQSNKVTAAPNVTSENLRIPSNCHSALAILLAQKLPESQSVNTDSWVNDTNGLNVKQNLSSYQFQVGSEYFPFARAVDTSGVNNGNAWNYVLQALDSHGAKYECSSIVPQEYYTNNAIYRPDAVAAGVVAITDDSLKFIMAARLDRDGNYSGVDTSNNDIQLNITRSAAAVAGLYYHAFVVHNRLMRISKASTIVFS
jgi:hypothetical protein